MDKQQPPEFFAEDIDSLMIGFPTSKVTFKTTKVDTDKNLQAANVLTLTMPTLILLSCCNLILDQLHKNEASLLKTALDNHGKLQNSLQKINIQLEED